ncbi:MAG: Gfo/Idh/MocA family oxidoreductase [Clostridiaceae bacterium]|nr:Gfo/Idh/MocA family oxidoreductase [Clostridiaceae bacterium]
MDERFKHYPLQAAESDFYAGNEGEKVLSAAVIGCGRVFPTHADALVKSSYAKLKAVVDIDETRAGEMAEKYNCEQYTDYRDVLTRKDIDVVHICTPHHLHFRMAVDVMNSGKHVLLEKPLAINVDDAQKIIETAKTTGKSLGVCFQNRYNPTSIWIKQFLDSGRAGRIIGCRAFLTWYRDEEYYKSEQWRGTWSMEGGGVLINQALHSIDLIQWFIGEADWLKASIDTRLLKGVIEVEDTAEITIGFKNGAKCLFYASLCYTMNSPLFLELHCENAVITLNDGIYVTYSDGKEEFIQNPDKVSGSVAYWGLSHEKLIEDYYGCLITGKSFLIDGEQAIKSLKIVKAAYESSRTGETIGL